MNDATTTDSAAFYSQTFEEYAASAGLSADRPDFDHLRKGWECEQITEQIWPEASTPCPSWCAYSAGHKYESVDYDRDTFLQTREVRFQRIHDSAKTGPASITQDEWIGDGQVTLEAPVISVAHHSQGQEVIDAAEARKRAAVLLNLADQLEEINQQ